MNKLISKLLVVTGLLIFAIGHAHAVVYELNLTGDVNNADISSSINSGTLYQNWNLNLEGLTSFTVYEGDSIHATIQFTNGIVSMPASDLSTWLYIGLYGAGNNAAFDTKTQATTKFYNGNIETASQIDREITSTDWLPTGAVLFPPDNISFTFDSVTIDCLVTKLGNGGNDSLNIEGATFYTQLQNTSAVPVPSSILLLGSGAIGLAAMSRRGRRKTS